MNNKDENNTKQQLNEPFIINLITDKNTYQNDSHIYGTVSLFVPQSAGACDDFSGIHLLLEGKETIKQFVPESSELEEFNENVAKVDTEVVSLSSQLIPGQYCYQFSLKLSESLPWSMHCISKDDERCSCGVYYQLTAYICRRSYSGAKNYPVVNCSRPISIGPTAPLSSVDSSSSSNSSRYGGNNERFGLKEFTIRSCLLKKGVIDLGFETDKTVLSPHSSVTVWIAGRNRSSIPIKHFLVRLVETVQWGYTNERILAQTKVEVDHIASWQKQKIEKRKKNHGPPVKTMPVTLHLKNARNTYKGGLVEVSHSLQIIAVMKGACTTTPKMTMATKVGQIHQLIPVMANAQVCEQHQQTSLLHEVSESGNKNNCNIPADIPEALPVLMDDSILALDESVVQQQYHCAPASCLHTCPVIQAQIMEPDINIEKEAFY